MNSELTAWWEEVSTASLVGTARRQVPPLPRLLGVDRPEARRQTALLDAAALGGAWRHAGRRTRSPAPVAPAGDDLRRRPPARAVQLLELLLRQSPVGSALSPELVHTWLGVADAHGCRVPHHLLPELLALATRHERLRDRALRVGDARGVWLASANPEWAWAGTPASASTDQHQQGLDPTTWAQQSTEPRVADVAAMRRTDPDAARELVLSTWSSDPAGDRAALLAALRTGLAHEDQTLLERALDDRSLKVREVAVQLLDALPASDRGTRMAERLRPLVQLRGLVRKTLEVELPLDPDDAGVRDGLTRPRGVGSVRGWWLQRLAAAAPLELWTHASRTDVAGTWRMLRQPDARVGVIEAVLARRDPTWAAAIVTEVWHPGLLALVPSGQLDAAATAQLTVAKTTEDVARVISAVPSPWGPTFSHAVVRRLVAEKEASVLVTRLVDVLATGLDPATLPALEKWRDALESGTRGHLARICQYLTLVPEISEAFR